jgi:hypothetical protein
MRQSILAAVLLGLSSTALAQVTINPSGGTGPGTGVRVHVGPTGQLQVIRNGTGQFFSQTATPGATTNPGILTGLSNGVYLAVGTTNVFGPRHFAASTVPGVTAAEFTPVSNTVTPQPGGSGSATTVLRATVGTRNYDLSVRYDYTFPNDFVTVTHTLTVPSGNTVPVRLYHALDAYLGGDDNGPSFFVQGPPTVIGGFRQASNIVLAWRSRGGVPWTGYYGGFYECMFRDLLCPMGSGGGNNVFGALTYNNWVDATVQDNGFAVMWNFGAAPGTQVVSNDLTFFSYQPTLTKAFGTTALQAGSTTTLTFSIDNVPGAPAQGNLGFQDTLPANLLLANTTVANTCGGMVTLNSTTLPHSIRLQSGALAPAVQRCTVVVNVTSSVAGAYTNGRSNISNLSVVENQVSDQILSVVQSAPVVTLASPGLVNLANATAYPVSGTCQSIAGTVTITVGTVVTSVPCTSGAFSATPNVAGLPDSATVNVSAAQTNAAGTGTTSRQTSKDTIAPTAPVFTSPSDAAFVGTTTPTVSGTAEPGTTVRVIVGGVTVCMALAQGNGVWTCTTSVLADGDRTMTTSATDPAGNGSLVSPPRTITIDTTPPAAPTINSPAQSATVGPNPSISGVAEPFAQVTVTEGAGTVCTVTANNLGQWSCPTTFGPSMRTIAATQRDRANNPGPAAPARTFTIANVPTVTLNPPAAITRANVGTYTLTGACMTSAGTVTVRVGTLTTMPTCTAGTFSTTLDGSSLADGPALAVSAAQTNVTGTGTDTRTALKDTQAPAAPGFTTPADGAIVNTTTPMISGTGVAQDSITVRRGATSVCTVIVPASGTWSCVASPIPDGPVSLTATATDPVGNASVASPPRDFTVDTAVPNAATITNPAQGATVGINPTLAGTAEANATVSVNEGALLICSVTANASGQWSCPTTYQPGLRSITATQRDTAGNLSAPSAARTFTVAPVPTVVLETPGAINGVNASSYPVSGQCTTVAGTVTVTVGTVNGTTPCSSGTFSTTVVVTAVADATSVPVVAAQTNASGTGTDTRSTTKDTAPPAAPTFSRPAEGAITSDTTPTFTGTAEPGSTVRVTRGGMTLCTTLTPASGTWSCVASMLGDGQIVVTATTTDVAGNTSASSMPRTFAIDTVAPPAPAFSSPAEGARVGLSPMISGTAEPFATVSVFEGSALVCQTTATMTGAFACPTTLGVGGHSLTARQTDQAGNVGPASAPRTFTVENRPTVILGTLQVINRARAMMYEVLGFCTVGAGPVSVQVGAVMGMATCVMGQFSTTLNVTSVADGPMVPVSASQTTAGGTTTDSRTVLKDTVPPPAPVITTPANELTTFTVDRPVLTGTAEPGSTVTIFINGQLAGTAQTNPMGVWQFTPPTRLADGRYEVKVNATDLAGNTGPDTALVPFSVDSTVPNPPVILTPEKDKAYDLDRPLEITGTSEPAARVTIFLDGRATFFVVADAQGRFSTTVPANSLAEGNHLVAAEALDPAGNQSLRSVDVTFFIRVPTLTYAGQGLVSCASVSMSGGFAPLAFALVALLSHRRRTR